jgi:hypothetical protein
MRLSFIMIFTAYFDESDTHGPSPTIILAGYVGHTYQWNRFEKKLARLQRDFGFKVFHAKDFKSRSKEFAGWSDQKCDHLIAALTDLVRHNLTEGMTTALPHERFLNEYRAPPIPKKMNLDSQYGACFRVCLGRLLSLLEARGNRDIMNVVIERGDMRGRDYARWICGYRSRSAAALASSSSWLALPAQRGDPARSNGAARGRARPILANGSRIDRDLRTTLSPQAEEARPIPGRAGDAFGDRGQARIGLLLPGKVARHDHHLMHLPLMLAHHHRPDLQMPHRLSPSLGEPIEALAHHLDAKKR